jgi:hypothetical protein
MPVGTDTEHGRHVASVLLHLLMGKTFNGRQQISLVR